MDDYIFEEVEIRRTSSPTFTLQGKEIDIWSEDYSKYHSRHIIDYIRGNLLSFEQRGEDPFYEIIGKKIEKEMLKNALLSGSNILFKGMKGYGKTTLSKSIAKLLPEKQLIIKGCKIGDDPLKPVCFSCKKKIIENDVIELSWMPQKWVRVSGDPMMTTRQLIGGISIQKIREGFELDHPEVFTPGRILKANRGIVYFDELGALPSALQTLLHELLEERQITTPEGDVIPMKIDTLFIASTNPENYRGTANIKEPLLDRLEEIRIGPPDTIEEEIEIGLQNMSLDFGAILPSWHLEILANLVRCARTNECINFGSIEVEPSCRATIKLFDHLKASATRNKHESAMLIDYGENYEVVKLGLRSRIELDFGEDVSKDEVIEKLAEESVNKICSEIYSSIPEREFARIIGEITTMDDGNGINVEENRDLKEYQSIWKFLLLLTQSPYELKSGYEILLESIRRCTNLIEKSRPGLYSISEEAAGSILYE